MGEPAIIFTLEAAIDRLIEYLGQILEDTDTLSIQRNAYQAIGRLTRALLGDGTIAYGLPCNPTSPASMSVQVGLGGIFSLQNLDNTPYGSLAADTAHQIAKDGYCATVQTITCAAPSTSGQSVVYLIEAGFSESDTTPLVLQYFNASNPTQAWAGPGNSGTPQNTLRVNTCTIQAIAGTPAATGSQAAPATTAGYIPLYYVTIPYGATTLTAANISVAAAAPFIAVPGTTRGLQPGRLLNIQTFVSNGTYTPTPGTNSIMVEAQAGGGGGAGAPVPSGGQVAVASGGSAGSYGLGYYTSGFSAAVSVTVGAGGSAGAIGGAGGNGGISSFGTLLSCPGGVGAPAGGLYTAPIVNAGVSGPAPATGANLKSIAGSSSTYAIGLSGANGAAPRGGDSFLGRGGATSSNAGGGTGTGYGAGASGVFLYAADSSGAPGAAGTPGIVTVWEYS